MSEILQGERVFFPEDQFDPQALQLLEQKATVGPDRPILLPLSSD
jgi:hypothetical protein